MYMLGPYRAGMTLPYNIYFIRRLQSNLAVHPSLVASVSGRGGGPPQKPVASDFRMRLSGATRKPFER